MANKRRKVRKRLDLLENITKYLIFYAIISMVIYMHRVKQLERNTNIWEEFQFEEPGPFFMLE